MHKTAATRKTSRAHNSHGYGLNGDIAKIRAALSHATSGVKGKANALISDQWNDVKDKTEDFSEHVSEMIAEKPFKSVAVLLAVGFVFGFLIRK
jgi:ElaB/YqjD/DUF883 family membrane-anchored ribosome-binding protein